MHTTVVMCTSSTMCIPMHVYAYTHKEGMTMSTNTRSVLRLGWVYVAMLCTLLLGIHLTGGVDDKNTITINDVPQAQCQVCMEEEN